MHPQRAWHVGITVPHTCAPNARPRGTTPPPSAFSLQRSHMSTCMPHAARRSWRMDLKKGNQGASSAARGPSFPCKRMRRARKHHRDLTATRLAGSTSAHIQFPGAGESHARLRERKIVRLATICTGPWLSSHVHMHNAGQGPTFSRRCHIRRRTLRRPVSWKAWPSHSFHKEPARRRSVAHGEGKLVAGVAARRVRASIAIPNVRAAGTVRIGWRRVIAPRLLERQRWR